MELDSVPLDQVASSASYSVQMVHIASAASNNVQNEIPRKNHDMMDNLVPFNTSNEGELVQIPVTEQVQSQGEPILGNRQE